MESLFEHSEAALWLACKRSMQAVTGAEAGEETNSCPTKSQKRQEQMMSTHRWRPLGFHLTWV